MFRPLIHGRDDEVLGGHTSKWAKCGITHLDHGGTLALVQRFWFCILIHPSLTAMSPVPGCFNFFQRAGRDSENSVCTSTKQHPVKEQGDSYLGTPAPPGDDLELYNPYTCSSARSSRLAKGLDLPLPPYSGSSGLPKEVGAGIGDFPHANAQRLARPLSSALRATPSVSRKFRSGSGSTQSSVTKRRVPTGISPTCLKPRASKSSAGIRSSQRHSKRPTHREAVDGRSHSTLSTTHCRALATPADTTSLLSLASLLRSDCGRQ